MDDRVGIEAEADFLKQYLKLEAERLEGLRYEIEIDPALIEDDTDVPALLVQPFVENAIWHGLSEKSGERTLHVKFMRHGEGIQCTITDNGVGRSASSGRAPGHRSLGMQLSRERIRLLARRMREEDRISVEDLKQVEGRSAGTRVTLQLH